jgi:hypothetical protein
LFCRHYSAHIHGEFRALHWGESAKLAGYAAIKSLPGCFGREIISANLAKNQIPGNRRVFQLKGNAASFAGLSATVLGSPNEFPRS